MQDLYGTGGEPYDGVAELWFASAADFMDRLKSSAGERAADELLGDERRFVDFPRSLLYFADEVAQIWSAGGPLARDQNTMLKVYYQGVGVAHLGQERAQRHWNAGHGSLARQYAEILPFVRYLQLHAADEALADTLRVPRDGMEPPTTLGHAELWADRRDIGGTPGPELAEAFRLLVEDICYFMDVANSSVFVAKEHVIVDEQIVRVPLPKP